MQFPQNRSYVLVPYYAQEHMENCILHQLQLLSRLQRQIHIQSHATEGSKRINRDAIPLSLFISQCDQCGFHSKSSPEARMKWIIKKPLDLQGAQETFAQLWLVGHKSVIAHVLGVYSWLLQE